MRSAVRKVAKYFPTAIISGRNRDKVFGRILFSNNVLTSVNCISFFKYMQFNY